MQSKQIKLHQGPLRQARHGQVWQALRPGAPAAPGEQACSIVMQYGIVMQCSIV